MRRKSITSMKNQSRNPGLARRISAITTPTKNRMRNNVKKTIKTVLYSTFFSVVIGKMCQAQANKDSAPGKTSYSSSHTCGVAYLAPVKPDAALIAAMNEAKQQAPKKSDKPEELRAKVIVAKKVITMDPMHPETQAIATLGGRILALGTLEQVKDRVKDMPHDIITDFADQVIYPGFIESHAHAQSAGLQWMSIYLGQMKQMQ